ncbi:Myosin-2 essential light chain [Vespula maculifrons]|uniref:Ornithine decarboxylase antizyme n=1 Tax=Vespula maculifrons TaxID=7453 RepID=A0ABD2CPZ1_VESMC
MYGREPGRGFQATPALLYNAGCGASVVVLMCPMPHCLYLQSTQRAAAWGSSREDELLKAVRSCESLRLTFTLHLTESTSVEWETVVWRRCLYIRVPSCLLPEGSKEGFVSLLEYAEETLHCTNIIVCLRKDKSDRGSCRIPFFGTVEAFCVEKNSPSKPFCCYGLAMLVRTFMFLGFTVLPPTHALVPPGSDAGNLYMLYAIECHYNEVYDRIQQNGYVRN